MSRDVEPAKRILVVDDDQDILNLISRRLANEKYHIVTAASAELARAVIAEGQPDVVLLDQMMPEVSGIELLRELRSDRRTALLPVLIITARSGVEAIVEGLEAGANDYICKPFDLTELKARIASMIRLRETHEALIGQRQQAELALASERVLMEELRRVNKQLAEANIQLKSLDTLKSEFVATVSHEIRTPMTAMRSSLELLMDGSLGAITGEQLEYMEIVARSIDRLTTLINDILDISRVESRRLSLDLQPCILEEIIEEAIETLRPRADEARIAISFEQVRPLPELQLDRGRIVQVLLNLIGNAINHCSSGTRVEISCAKVNLDGPGRPGFVQVSVADDGPGIPSHVLPRLFERFYQHKRQKGSGPKGTGLGLAIARGIVEAHSGELKVTSVEGEGSCFCFTIPIV